MAYKDLERRLEETGQRQELEPLLQKIKEENDEDYAITLSYVLSVLYDLERHGVEDFAVIGGYGVLFQAMNYKGAQILPFWRGSTDFDLGAQTPQLESILKGSYAYFEKTVSHFHQQKMDIRVRDVDLADELVIDLYLVFKGKPMPLQEYLLDDKFWTRVRRVPIFGIEIPVASTTDLLQMKLAVKKPTTGLPRDHDILDIFTLCSLLEKNESIAAAEMWRCLPLYGKVALKKILNSPHYNHQQKIYTLPLVTVPSEQYLEDLRNLADRVQEF